MQVDTITPERLEELFEESRQAIEDAEDEDQLNRRASDALGSEGWVSQVTSSIGELSDELKPVIGREINQYKNKLENLVDERREQLRSGREEGGGYLDPTLSGDYPLLGGLHPLTRTMEEIVDVFVSMGFDVVEGPEIETEWNNFTALNIPENHPARGDVDTLKIAPNLLLRTHTSPVQIRTMEKIDFAQTGRVQVVSPGRVYRRDRPDRTHLPMFHQVEGLLVADSISFAHLKGVLEEFAHAMFGEDTSVRLRPDYFPFVEPGAEVAISCPFCGGEGCRVCEDGGWIEILGAGMVHPQVLRNVDIDPEENSGFAFGIGVDRVAQILYQVDDARSFVENNYEFLRQFTG